MVKLENVWYGRTGSDGLRAAIATATQIPTKTVPDCNVTELVAEGWPVGLAQLHRWLELSAWATQRGLHIEMHHPPPWTAPLWIGVGNSRLDKQSRAVVMAGHHRLHDPLAKVKISRISRIAWGFVLVPVEPVESFDDEPVVDGDTAAEPAGIVL